MECQTTVDTQKLNLDLVKAADLFVMTKFKDCLHECKKVIACAKMEAEQERNDMIIEAATALGIQALAETDCWMESTGFIMDVYGNIDLCPPRIIQVCILLHAHVREYLPCHNLVHIWLKNPQNLAMKQCAQVIQIYASHVLCPTGCQEMIRDIVDKCVSLTLKERDSLLELSFRSQSMPCSSENVQRSIPLLGDRFDEESSQPYSPGEERLGHASLSESGEDDHSALESGPVGIVVDPISWLQTKAIETCQTLGHFLANQVTSAKSKRLKLLFMAVVTVLALIYTQTGDFMSSLGRFLILWRIFVQRFLQVIKPKSR